MEWTARWSQHGPRRGVRLLDHAAISYSWMSPPKRSRRWTCGTTPTSSSTRSSARSPRNPAEVPRAEYHEPAQTVCENGLHPAFGKGVRRGGPDRSADHADAFACEDVIEGARELGVAIADKDPDVRALVGVRRTRSRFCQAWLVGRRQCPRSWFRGARSSIRTPTAAERPSTEARRAASKWRPRLESNQRHQV